MDLQTENRIATILLREAAELRRQAEKEGVQAYLRRPTVRGRPNSRFLTATVLGVQQANRAVEVNEMWRAREKELEMDKVHNARSSHHRHEGHRFKESSESIKVSDKKRRILDSDTHVSTSNTTNQQTPEKNEGLKDEEIEEFLHARVKRGRGAVGSRMDETGPYLESHSDDVDTLSCINSAGQGAILGSPKPCYIKAKDERSRSGKEHSKKHKSRVKSNRKKEKH